MAVVMRMIVVMVLMIMFVIVIVIMRMIVMMEVMLVAVAVRVMMMVVMLMVMNVSVAGFTRFRFSSRRHGGEPGTAGFLPERDSAHDDHDENRDPAEQHVNVKLWRQNIRKFRLPGRPGWAKHQDGDRAEEAT
jgi:hypothetical protein